MRDVFVQTRNVSNFMSAVETARQERGPKIIIAKGRFGLGKTQTCAWLGANHGAVYMVAEAGWSIGWFFKDLCFELGLKPAYALSDRARQIRETLAKERPTLIIDEADYLRHDKRVLETVKSLHDRCDVPVILVSNGEIGQVIKSYGQIDSRICARVEFEEITKAELPDILKQLAEVNFDVASTEALSKHVRTMRDLTRLLPRIEKAVRGKNARRADNAIIDAVAAKVKGHRGRGGHVQAA